jgi:hypothetical protein
MAKPPFQFSLKAVFAVMTAVALFFADWPNRAFLAVGVTLFLISSVLLSLLIVFWFCYGIALGLSRIYLVMVRPRLPEGQQ